MRNWILGLTALIVLAACGTQADADILPATENIKVFVCKYTGTPGVDEALQGGGNPISIAYQPGREPGGYFNDSQGRSYVLAYDEGQDEPPVTDCPPPNTGTTTTTSTTSSTTTTTCPDCGINTVVITPPPPPPPPPTTVPVGSTTTSVPGATTSVPGATTTTTVTTTIAPGVTTTTRPPTGTAPPTTGPAALPETL